MDGSIELKPLRRTPPSLRKPLPGILDVYDGLRGQEKQNKHQAKLEAAFVGADADDMKFSHSLQFNAVAEWSNQYIAYSNLKKLIYTLEKEVNQRDQALAADAESTHLLDSTAGDPDKVFAQALDRELRKIEEFYQVKEAEVLKEVEDLLSDEEALSVGVEALDASTVSQSSRRRSTSGVKLRKDSLFRQWSFPRRRRTSVSQPMMERIDSEDSDDDADGDSHGLRRSTTAGTVGRSPSAIAHRTSFGTMDAESDAQMTESTHVAAITKKRMINCYVSLCELKSFLELNKTGFTKVLKKYDKTLDRKLKSRYVHDRVDQSPSFQPERKEKISEKIGLVEQTYADIYTDGVMEKAKRELGLDLREHVVWERNTVWREMIGIERKAQAAHIGTRQTIVGQGKDRKHGQDAIGDTKELNTPAGRFRIPAFLFQPSIYYLLIALATFLILLLLPLLKLPEQQNCLAMVVFVSILWATEVSDALIITGSR